VVFREIKDVFKQEILPKDTKPKKIEFELKDDESNSTKEHESKEGEPHNMVLRRSVWKIRQPERYIPPNFCSIFSLFITDDDPRTIRKAVDLEDDKFWKKAMVEEMEALDKNEAWDLMELQTR
jgi:hypothetical protein